MLIAKLQLLLIHTIANPRFRAFLKKNNKKAMKYESIY